MSIYILSEASKGRRPQGTTYKRLGHYWRARDAPIANMCRMVIDLFSSFLFSTQSPQSTNVNPRSIEAGSWTTQPADYLRKALNYLITELGWQFELSERHTNVWFLQQSEFSMIIKENIWEELKKIIHAIFLWLKRAERHGPRCYNMALLSKARSDAGAETLCRPGQSRSVWRAKARNSVTSFHRMETSALCR